MSQREFKWQLCEKTEWEKKDKIGNRLIVIPKRSLLNNKSYLFVTKREGKYQIHI
jgi:hypothetical protein